MKWKDLEENGPGLIDVQCQHLLEGLRKLGKLSVNLAGIPSHIRTVFLPNTSLERSP
jgi:hypothetical protein